MTAPTAPAGVPDLERVPVSTLDTTPQSALRLARVHADRRRRPDIALPAHLSPDRSTLLTSTRPRRSSVGHPFCPVALACGCEHRRGGQPSAEAPPCLQRHPGRAAADRRRDVADHRPRRRPRPARPARPAPRHRWERRAPPGHRRRILAVPAADGALDQLARRCPGSRPASSAAESGSASHPSTAAHTSRKTPVTSTAGLSRRSRRTA